MYRNPVQPKTRFTRFTTKNMRYDLREGYIAIYASKVTRGYKDGLQPETLADGNWLVKQNQPVSKIETKSDTNLRSLYFFFLGGVTATAPSRDLTDNKKKEEGGLKQRRKQKEAAQGDPEPKKGNQEKEKYPSRVQS